MRMNATLNLKGTETVAELKSALEGVPDDAKFTVKSYAGDRPWDSGYSTITFNWEG